MKLLLNFNSSNTLFRLIKALKNGKTNGVLLTLSDTSCDYTPSITSLGFKIKFLHLTARQELEQSLEFESSLSHITDPNENRRNATLRYNPTTTGAAKTYPGLPKSWTSYIQSLFDVAGSIKIDDNEKLILSSPKYLERLGKLLKKTDPRVIANYLGWRAARSGQSTIS